MFSPGEIGNNGYVILFLVECLGGGGGWDREKVRGIMGNNEIIERSFRGRLLQIFFKRVVSRLNSSFCLSMPVTHLY